MLTEDDYKKLVSRVGFKCGVSPGLISTRLLSPDDKRDLKNGVINDRDLRSAVESWKKAALPDYATGSADAMRDWFKYV